MIEIGIIDDSESDVEKLKANIKKFLVHLRMEYHIRRILMEGNYMEEIRKEDLIFLDIDMPEINGIKLAENIRKESMTTQIVFVTNFFQYAIDGYHVNAIDYILKPIEYESFSLKMKRIIQLCDSHSASERKITIRTKNGIKILSIDDIEYIEVKGHYLTYHMLDLSSFISRGQLKEIKESLGNTFQFCNSYCIVNLKHLKGIQNEIVSMTHASIPISRTKRKLFLDSLSAYLGGLA